jgi:Asp-tRNA(Asn)/Glu-tRNA(Gln) amidotransferase C subunit
VKPTSHVINRPLERDDVPQTSLARAEALGNAPDMAPEAGLFKVPRVMG